MSVSTPSAGANDETGPPRPADDVDHQVKGAVARPVSTGCPTVEPELNRRFDGEWERNGMRDGSCELVSKIRGRIHHRLKSEESAGESHRRASLNRNNCKINK